MSNWEDTIMSDEQIEQVIKRYYKSHLDSVHFENACKLGKVVAQAQAEITWRAREPEIVEARKVGIREIMKLAVENNVLCPEEKANENNCIVCKNFYVKLKECGIGK